jgi:hypothetical protein
LKYPAFTLREDMNGELVQWDSYMNRAMLIVGDDRKSRMDVQVELVRKTPADSENWVKKLMYFENQEHWSDLLKTLHEVKDEMLNRYHLMEEDGASNYTDYAVPFPTYLLMLDQFEALYADNITPDIIEVRDEIINVVSHILRLGRASGMRLIIAGAPELPSLMSMEMLSMIDVRIAATKLKEVDSWTLMHSNAASWLAPLGEWLVWFGPQNKFHKILFRKS